MKKETLAIGSADFIENHIFFIRDHKVMLDHDLAILYHVTVKRLKEQVQRNIDRFPKDFMFELTIEETKAVFSSRSQFASLKRGRNIKYGSYAFTEQGVAMLSGILHSPRAVEVNIAIMRAFVKMRRLLLANQELAKKLEELENKLIGHDAQIGEIVEAIRGLMQLPEKPIPKIGYKPC